MVSIGLKNARIVLITHNVDNCPFYTSSTYDLLVFYYNILAIQNNKFYQNIFMHTNIVF